MCATNKKSPTTLIAALHATGRFMSTQPDTESYYNNLLINTGIQYLEINLMQNKRSVSALAESKHFWIWWQATFDGKAKGFLSNMCHTNFPGHQTRNRFEIEMSVNAFPTRPDSFAMKELIDKSTALLNN